MASLNIIKIFFCIFSLVLCIPAFAAEQLIIEPNDGRQPLLTAIKNATSSIDLVMYGWTDERFLNAFIKAKQAGKKLRVLLEPTPYKTENENAAAIQQLQTHHISLQSPHPAFKLTHQKTFLIDKRYAIVMTFNLTHSSFKNERNFALIIDKPDVVKEISDVFNNDWLHKSSQMHNTQLIWSPENSREKILHFINNAKSELKIYAQDISDYQIVGALAKAARSGKSVTILTSNQSPKLNKKFKFLRKAGVKIQISKNYFIHAKVIIADHQRAILGSTNLSHPSIEDNRELSVITNDPLVVGKLIETFDRDWRN